MSTPCTRRQFAHRLWRQGGGWVGAVCALGSTPAWALPAPAGKVLLTLSGKVRQTNAGGAAAFDMALLAGLPQREFSTGTPWFSGLRRFSGPLLRDVLTAAGAHGQTLRATALNDYVTEIPSTDADQYPVIVARLLDGQPMTVRDKGPLWIVYPYDSAVELRSERYYNRSAWQLKAIEVR